MVLAIDLGGTNLSLGLVDNGVVVNMTFVHRLLWSRY